MSPTLLLCLFIRVLYPNVLEIQDSACRAFWSGLGICRWKCTYTGSCL